MIEHVLRSCKSVGKRQTLVVRDPSQPEIDKSGQKFQVAFQDPARTGTAAALIAARPHIDPECDTILVLFADNPLLSPESMLRVTNSMEISRAVVGMLTVDDPKPGSRGRIIRRDGRIVAIKESVTCRPEEMAITEVNCGAMALRASWAWPALEKLTPSPTSGELFLTELVGSAASAGEAISAVQLEDLNEGLGCDDLESVAEAEKHYFRRRASELMALGVRIRDPDSVEISPDSMVSPGTVIERNVSLIGSTRIGPNSQIGPDSAIEDSILGSDCSVISSRVIESSCESGVSIGPNALIRAGSRIQERAHVGNCVEIKNSQIGPGALIGHLCYVGDANVGKGAVVGAGAITCNFDGAEKHRTVIGDQAFIGSNTSLVAPVRIGNASIVGAGSVVTRDVPDGATVFGNPARKRSKPSVEHPG